MPAPSTGGAGCALALGLGGFIGGAATGALVVGTLFFPVFVAGPILWAVGNRRADDSDPDNDKQADDMLIAGKVLTGFGLVFAGSAAFVCGIWGGIAGAHAGLNA